MSEPVFDRDLDVAGTRRLDYLREVTIGKPFPRAQTAEPTRSLLFLVGIAALAFGLILGQNFDRGRANRLGSSTAELAGLPFRLPATSWEELPETTSSASNSSDASNEVMARRSLVQARRLLRNSETSRVTSIDNAFDARLLLGDHHVRRADWRVAIKHYQHAVALRPDDFEARASVAECHGRLGMLEIALEMWEGIARDARENLPWKTEAGRYVAAIKTRLKHADAEALSSASAEFHAQRLKEQKLTVSERLRLSVGFGQAARQSKSLERMLEADRIMADAVQLIQAPRDSDDASSNLILPHTFLLIERARLRRDISTFSRQNREHYLRLAQADTRAAIRQAKKLEDTMRTLTQAKAQRLLARLLASNGKYSEAIEVAHAAIANFDSLITQGKLELEADVAGTWVQVAGYYRADQKLEKANEAYRHARIHYDRALDLSSRPDLQSLIREVDQALDGNGN